MVVQGVYCVKKVKIRTITLILTILVATSGYAEPFAYSVNSDGPDSSTSDSLYRIDLADGSVELIGKVRPNERSINSDIEGLAFDVNGTLYGVDDADETLLSINTGSGQALSVTGNAFNLQLGAGQVYDFGMTFTCDNSILVVSDQTQTLYSSEIGSPEAKIIGSANSMSLPITGVAAWGDDVYGIGQGVNDDQQTLIPNLYRVDRESGSTTLIGPLGGLVAPYADAGLAFDADGGLWALTDRSNFGGNGAGSELLRINPATGAAEQVLQVGIIGFESLAITSPGGCQTLVDIVPKGVPASGPTSLVLLSLILAMFGMIQLRRFN
jgi:hypothetical protein